MVPLSFYAPSPSRLVPTTGTSNASGKLGNTAEPLEFTDITKCEDEFADTDFRASQDAQDRLEMRKFQDVQ